MHAAKLFLVFIAAASPVALATARAADTEVSSFDGQWDVTLTCPPHHQDDDDDAKGYVHHFPAEVKGSALRGTHGTEGQPSWHLLTGSIAPDDTALLTLEGIVNNPAYAINNAQRGKPYTYRVRAQFAPTSGIGHRAGKRKCDFAFKRK